MAKRKIKFIARAVRWFDRLNGNTYHSVRIERVNDGAVIACEWTYGYGDHYRQTALKAMAEAKWLPVKYRKGARWMSYERENNYPIHWEVHDGLKREMIDNGVL